MKTIKNPVMKTIENPYQVQWLDLGSKRAITIFHPNCKRLYGNVIKPVDDTHTDALVMAVKSVRRKERELSDVSEEIINWINENIKK